jgi:hypothetical protein
MVANGPERKESMSKATTRQPTTYINKSAIKKDKRIRLLSFGSLSVFRMPFPKLAFKAEIDLTYMGGIERGKRNSSLLVMASRSLSVPLSMSW